MWIHYTFFLKTQLDALNFEWKKSVRKVTETMVKENMTNVLRQDKLLWPHLLPTGLHPQLPTQCAGKATTLTPPSTSRSFISVSSHK